MINYLKATLLSTLIFSSFSEADDFWEYKHSTDKMTDEKNCYLDNSMDNNYLAFSFQGDKLYIVSANHLTFEDFHIVFVRVDKNPQMELIVRTVSSQILALDPSPELEELKRQFKKGNRYMARTLIAGDRLLEDKGGLHGFTKNLSKFESCNAKA